MCQTCEWMDKGTEFLHQHNALHIFNISIEIHKVLL